MSPDPEPIYQLNEAGIYIPRKAILHREEEYDSAGFEVLCDMQGRHFWYLGRHRFLLAAFRREITRIPGSKEGLRAIDLGGGGGGWIRYLSDRFRPGFRELALSDSSLRALESAGAVVGGGVERFQTDLLDLGWRDRWDVAFLLDVLEHIPQDKIALRQIFAALRPGGLLFVTCPALAFFWSYNDELARHVRRYSIADFEELGRETGFELRLCRYFMFLLSPLLWLSRLKRVNLQAMSREEVTLLAKRTHRVPPPPINWALRMLFSIETPLGLSLPFPWGTSLLGVFQKPVGAPSAQRDAPDP